MCERNRIRKYYRAKKKYAKKYYRYEQSHRIVKGIKEKRCRKCKKWKAESEFYRHRRNKDGLEVWCKVCINKANRKYRKRRLTAKN